jgi:hypothetical protein
MAPAFPLTQVCYIFRKTFQEHYTKTSTEPEDWELCFIEQKQDHAPWKRHGAPVIFHIQSAAGISLAIAEDIQKQLQSNDPEPGPEDQGEKAFADSAHYYLNPDLRYGDTQQIHDLEQTLIRENRLLSNEEKQWLRPYFDILHEIRCNGFLQVLTDVGPELHFKHLYRARVFQSDEKLYHALTYPAQQIGPPPQEYAFAGRMNPHGKSVFYGSNIPSVSLSEVRPPVGAYVVIAKFDILRQLRLLDIEAIKVGEIKGSIFDPRYKITLEKFNFLRELAYTLTFPVMPDDREDYLISQAISEFLAEEKHLGIDGVIFSSVQSDNAINFVLFNKASRVKDIPVNTRTHLVARESEWMKSRWITKGSRYKHSIRPDSQLGVPQPNPLDDREVTLAIDVDALKVYMVDSARYITSEIDLFENKRVIQ